MFGLRNWFRKPTGRGKTLSNPERRRPALGLERLDDRLVPATVNMTGGAAAIIPNVQVEAVYYGQQWNTPAAASFPELSQERQDMNAFLKDIVASNYMTGLAQYTGIKLAGRTPVAVAPGKGTFVKDDVVNAVAPNNTYLTEAAIQRVLADEIGHSRVDAPDANKLYFVVLPPGVRVGKDYDNVAGKNLSGGGHHDAFALNGVQVHYAVIEHGLSGFSAAGSTSTETTFQKMTEVASHELAEAVTRPDVDSGGWQGTYADPVNIGKTKPGEIGDITQNLPPSSGALGVVDGYMVQKYWSRSDNTSIVPGGVGYTGLIQPPPELTGAHFVAQSLVAGVRQTVELQFTFIGAPDLNGKAWFVGTWADLTTGGHPANVTGYLTAQGRAFAVTVLNSARSDPFAAKLFTGVIAPPDGNWATHAELTGNAAGVAYFGVEVGYPLLPTGSGGYNPPPTAPPPGGIGTPPHRIVLAPPPD